MNENERFLNEYIEWSSQEKFKDFKFIPKISPQKKEELIDGSLVNTWAFLFGPFYYLYLGINKSIFYIILSLLFFTYGYYIGLLLYVLLSLFLAIRVNTYYINFLKNKKEKYARFNPDETTPYFNISNARLIFLSLITGGFYLMYWVYKNIKAVRDFQKDPVNPFWQAILLSFTSIHIFKAIAYSVKSLGYKEDLKPVGSAFFVFLLTGLYGVEFNGQEGELLPLNLLMVTILFYWLMIALTICLFVKYQKAISFYATEKNIPDAKVSSWECFFVFFGCLLNAGLIYTTITCFLKYFGV